jgi:hypothetical protein
VGQPRRLSLGGFTVFLYFGVIHFGHQLRLDSATGPVKFCFGVDDVHQHSVQSLGTEQHQAKHQHEEYFDAESHDSPVSLVVGNNGGACLFFLRIFIGHS